LLNLVGGVGALSIEFGVLNGFIVSSVNLSRSTCWSVSRIKEKLRLIYFSIHQALFGSLGGKALSLIMSL